MQRKFSVSSIRWKTTLWFANYRYVSPCSGNVDFVVLRLWTMFSMQWKSWCLCCVFSLRLWTMFSMQWKSRWFCCVFSLRLWTVFSMQWKSWWFCCFPLSAANHRSKPQYAQLRVDLLRTFANSSPSDSFVFPTFIFGKSSNAVPFVVGFLCRGCQEFLLDSCWIDIGKTNLPDVRVTFRTELHDEELRFMSGCSTASVFSDGLPSQGFSKTVLPTTPSVQVDQSWGTSNDQCTAYLELVKASQAIPKIRCGE